MKMKKNNKKIKIYATAATIAVLATTGIVFATTPLGDKLESGMKEKIELWNAKEDFYYDMELMHAYYVELDNRNYNEENFLKYDEETYNKLLNLVYKYDNPEMIKYLNISEYNLNKIHQYSAELDDFTNQRISYYSTIGNIEEDLEIMSFYYYQLKETNLSEDGYDYFYSLVDKYLNPQVVEYLNIPDETIELLNKYKTSLENYDIKEYREKTYGP